MHSNDPFLIAAVQICPVYHDRDATIAKACEYIAEAGRRGISLAVFPEAFVPGYPLWIWFIPPVKTQEIRPLYAELVEQSIDIPGPETALLCEAAGKAQVAIAIGVNERNTESSGSSLFNTTLYIGPDGAILGKHRKLVPTVAERLVWGQGGAEDLDVYNLKVGKLGGLICWENYMPLARYAMYQQGVELYAAPTWDRGEPWMSTVRHIAKEGRCHVISCCSPVRLADIPDRLAFKTAYLSGVDEWLNPGMSLICDPDGKVMAGPMEKEEGLLVAEARRPVTIGSRFQLDTTGHYSRPDVFKLTVSGRTDFPE